MWLIRPVVRWIFTGWITTGMFGIRARIARNFDINSRKACPEFIEGAQGTQRIILSTAETQRAQRRDINLYVLLLWVLFLHMFL